MQGRPWGGDLSWLSRKERMLHGNSPSMEKKRTTPVNISAEFTRCHHLAQEGNMSGLAFNLEYARRAVYHVQQHLPRGAGNRPESPPDGNACVRYVRGTMVCTADFIPHLARRAVETGCGNCGEQAAVAFMYLLGVGARPLDYMNLDNADGIAIHSFVVIDFCCEGDGMSCNWGPSAVICDPWDDGQAYPAWQISQHMSLFRRGFTVRSLRRDT